MDRKLQIGNVQDSFLKSKCTSEIQMGDAETWYIFSLTMLNDPNYVPIFTALNNIKQ